ncbi:MAG: zeta toxin family protein [Candidatus Methylacidiphilales bacterium]
MPDELKNIVVILAGPNGAGKTSFYELFLSKSSLPFVNADTLALEHFGRVAQNDEEALAAAKIAEAERQRLVQENQSFIFETVLSDSKGAKIQFLRNAQKRGYFVEAIYIGLATPELSQARVIQRVDAGGHDVPDDKITARYPRTLKNLALLIDVVDRLTLYDNSQVNHPFQFVAYFESGQIIQRVAHLPPWTETLDLPRRDLPTTQIITG